MSNLDKKLDEIFGVYIDPQIPATTDETVLSAIYEAKQAIKQLIADEMGELIVDKPTGTHNADSLLERDVLIYNQATAYLRTKLAEWLKEAV